MATYKLFILFIITVFFCSCIKQNYNNCPTQFQIPASIKPYKESYSIGDTIVLKFNFNNQVYERNTSKKYNFENISWKPFIRFYKIDSSIAFSEGRNYVSIISNNTYDWYQFNSGGEYVFFDFFHPNDSLKATFNITLKKKGLYYLTCGGGLVMSDQEFPGKCKRYSFDVYTEMNNKKSNNIHLLSDSPNEHYNTWVLKKPQKRFHDGGGYCFRVVE